MARTILEAYDAACRFGRAKLIEEYYEACMCEKFMRIFNTAS